ncbi:JAB domain-containing protein [uncultured Psychroserpens sp.]|uniref:JAB domain-containing protein n=1 Tax=uncultured Psychroserpens sp. TaxID=255436 RepID=UPI0026268513|nr:JAB domain-containing protein [uncultured Psychroserpens sp.]
MKPLLPSTQLFSCCELEMHYKRALFKTMIHIRGSKEANHRFRQFIDLNKINHKEFFWVMCLTNANRVTVISEIGSGSTKGVHMNTKEVFQNAILSNSAAIIIAHNHPSGILKPSETDKNYTQKLIPLCEVLDITLLDHLILTQEDYYSFSDNHIL